MSALKSHPQLLWLLFPIYFAGLWMLVSFIISRTGWNSFAKKFPAPTRPAGTSYNSSTAWFGIFGHYNNVVRVIFTDAGVYFYVLFLFRGFHPPFLVPWERVKSLEKKDGFFGRHYWMEIGDSAGRIRLRLPAKAELDLSRFSKVN